MRKDAEKGETFFLLLIALFPFFSSKQKQLPFHMREVFRIQYKKEDSRKFFKKKR